MALFDRQLMVSNQQAVTSVGNNVSTDAIDTLSAAFDSGTLASSTPATTDNLGNTIPADFARNQGLDFYVQVDTTFTSGGAATMAVEVVTSANSDLSSPTVLCSSSAIAVATLVAGYQFRINLPAKGATSRYLGLRYVVATAAMTAGKVTAGVIKADGRPGSPNVFS